MSPFLCGWWLRLKAHHGKDVPAIHCEDVQVYQGHDRARVTDWTPLRGEGADTQLFVLMDDSSDTSVGSQFGDLKKFINAQPATTSIAIGYMRNGTVDVRQDFTKDHAQAAKALRLPTGPASAGGSPYFRWWI